MSFTTNELLYPLSKGDKPGHNFHGNQYETVASGAAELSKPLGHFQFGEKDCEEIAAIAKADTVEIYSDMAVALAKKLGYDKPATLEPKGSFTPDFYRGCNKAGAQSLTKPLTSYGGKGGISHGPGVYITTEHGTAYKYAEGQQKGTLVSISLDPNARTIGFDEIMTATFDGNHVLSTLPNLPDDFDQWSEEAKAGFKQIVRQPTLAAMALGYQVLRVTNEHFPIDTAVVLDRSVMKVAY